MGVTFVFCRDCSSRDVDTINVPAPHNEKQTTTIASFSTRLTDEIRSITRVSVMLRQTAEISKAINPGAVSITPTGLQCVTAHQIESDKLEAFVGIAHMWTRNVTEHIRLAAARRARARAPQQFEFQKRFGAIVPRERQFVADQLHVS
jgi:hypothetical protein